MLKAIKIVCVISSFLAFALGSTDIDVHADLDSCPEDIVAEHIAS